MGRQRRSRELRPRGPGWRSSAATRGRRRARRGSRSRLPSPGEISASSRRFRPGPDPAWWLRRKPAPGLRQTANLPWSAGAIRPGRHRSTRDPGEDARAMAGQVPGLSARPPPGHRGGLPRRPRPRIRRPSDRAHKHRSSPGTARPSAPESAWDGDAGVRIARGNVPPRRAGHACLEAQRFEHPVLCRRRFPEYVVHPPGDDRRRPGRAQVRNRVYEPVAGDCDRDCIPAGLAALLIDR